MLRMILRDLYGWDEPITAGQLAAAGRDDPRAGRRPRLASLDFRSASTSAAPAPSIARRGSGEDDARLQYSLEWAFFTRCQWGEFDTALYELEHCWGRQPEPPSPIGGQRPPSDRVIGCLDDVHAAIEHYVATIPYEQLVGTATCSPR